MTEHKPLTAEEVELAVTHEYAVTDAILRQMWAELQAARTAREAAERERDAMGLEIERLKEEARKDADVHGY